MEIKKSIIINRPAAVVWEVLGTQFGVAYKWASGLNHSESYGKPELESAHCNDRSCELPTGNIKEVIRTFDTKNYALAYEVLEDFPFFVDKGINHWKLTELGGQTEVNMHLKITTKGFVGKLMGPMMKLHRCMSGMIMCLNREQRLIFILGDSFGIDIN